MSATDKADLRIDRSSSQDRAVAEEIRIKHQEAWSVENRNAIQEYNEHVEEHGVFSDGMRGF